MIKCAMSSRERVERVLRREQPDRLPMCYYGNGNIDAALKAHFGSDCMAVVLDRMGCDFGHAGAPYRGPQLHATDERLGYRRNPIWGVVDRWIEHGSGGYWEAQDFPLRDADVDDILAWPYPDPDDFDYEAMAAGLATAGDKAVMVGGAGTGDVMNSSTLLFGMEEMLVRLMEDDEALLMHIAKRNQIQCTVLERELAAGAGAITAVHIGEDLGSQRGPLISHELFRRHVAPNLQHVIDIAKRFGLPVVMHSCGSSHHFFDELASMGVSCMETLQPEAEGMQPERLKRAFGDRLAFMGGLSTAGVLAKGTAEEVRAEVRAICDAFMPGGGYIFAPTHQVQDDTPLENVLAAFDEALSYGRY